MPRRRAPRMVPAALVVLFVALAACSGDDGGSVSATDDRVPGDPCAALQPIGEFGEVEVAIGGEPECLLLAETPAQRARGLMEVTDLEGYPGMLFAFPADADGGFWMRNTPMPLSIAYLDADGAIVSTADMEPCDDVATCPSYPADGPYRYTVEVPQGRLGELGLVGDARLTMVGEADPS